MSINELFVSTNEMESTSNRGLPGTAELTSLAGRMAREMLQTMEADITAWRPRIQESAINPNELEKLIDEIGPEYGDSANFLNDLADEIVDGMLKSQQSKRSRAKSKTMTLDNYITLLTAAIAERIIREVTGRVKTHSYTGRQAGVVDYTGAQLEALAADQDALRKEIRNVQSKKSIMKSKADFSEADERWLALLKAEQQLKDLRVTNAPTKVVEVDSTRNALAEMLAGKDISKMKSAEAHELLEVISKMAVQE